MNERDEDPAGRGPGEPAPDEVPTTPAPAVGESPRRFLRSRDDRIIAGVCGGLGRYFDIDPVIIRIAFAVSVLFGGLGVLAYLAVALFVPSDDGSGAPAQGGRGREIAQILGFVVIAIAALAAFGLLAAGAAFATGLGFGLPVAVLIVLIGIVLAVLSFRGGARWLLVPALALSIGVGVAAAADLDLEGGVGDRDYRPVSAAAIPADGYELGVGRLAVDLRGIDWRADRTLSLETRIGAGQLVVAVPAEVCVVADAHVGAGDLMVAGQRADGVDIELATAEGARGAPRLLLDAEADLGQIKVVNDDDADISDPGRDWDHDWDDGGYGDTDAMRAANARACQE
ncbi:MAG TPA: PspC domain-containing protein [Solirubrobacterales bacterium]|nr:PspC domain-containing protein [Solirubrobacterales bacterium]